ncbi:MAG: hypothetical protein KDA54_18925 [Phycisphaerales bacterium]|nr:hypothetical protein [Phycisphaerales bacterium]
MSASSMTRKPAPDSAINLAECLAHLINGAGGSADPNAILTALGAGLAFFFREVPGEEIPELAECHDFALPEAAGLFGIRLRAMHPPRARFGLSESAEFAGHFADSYVPLIQRAIENGQRVLTLHGWSSTSSTTWGIVERCEQDGDAIWGAVPDRFEPTQLSHAALQCYVVEEIAPVEPTAEAVLARGAETALNLNARGTVVYPGLLTGETVLLRLIELHAARGDQLSSDGLIEVIKQMEHRRAQTAAYLEQHVSDWDATTCVAVKTLASSLEKDVEACVALQNRPDAHALKSQLEIRLGLDRTILRDLASISSSDGQ